MATLKYILGQGAHFTINKKMLLNIGLEPTLLLQHLIDLYENYFERKDYDDFFQKQIDIEVSTGLSKYQQRKALAILIEYNFVSVVKKGIPAKNYYTINTKQILHFMSDEKLNPTSKKSKPLKSEKVNDINKEKEDKEKNKQKSNKEKDVSSSPLFLELINEINNEE